MGFRKKMEWWYTSIFCCNIHFLKKTKHRGDTGTPLTKFSGEIVENPSPHRSFVARSAPQSPELHRIRRFGVLFFWGRPSGFLRYGKGGKELEKRRWALFDTWSGLLKRDFQFLYYCTWLWYIIKPSVRNPGLQVKTQCFNMIMKTGNPGFPLKRWVSGTLVLISGHDNGHFGTRWTILEHLGHKIAIVT